MYKDISMLPSKDCSFYEEKSSIEIETQPYRKDTQMKAVKPIVKEQSIPVCDIMDMSNPQCVAEYASEIFSYLRENEVIYTIINTDSPNTFPSLGT